MADQPEGQRPNLPGRTPPPTQPPEQRVAGLRVGRVRGVPIYVSPFALIFAVLVATLVADPLRDRLNNPSDYEVFLLAGLTALGFLLSLLLHELGHALTALWFKLRVKAVTIHGFAGFTEIEPEPQTARREFLVGFSGPFVNGVLAGLCFLGLWTTSSADPLAAVLEYLAITNLILFIFNLAPGLPLDGGRLVVATVWGITRSRLTGLRAGAYGGFVVAGGLVVLALVSSESAFGGLYWILLAAFIGFGAYQSLRAAQLREKLPGLQAGRLIRKTLPVEGAVPLAQALRRAQEVGATAVAVIDRDGIPQMIMNGASVDALPEHRRPWVRTEEVSRTIEPTMVLDADLAGEDLLNHIQRYPAPEYLVTQNGRPVGVLVMVDLIARIDRNAALRMAARQH